VRPQTGTREEAQAADVEEGPKYGRNRPLRRDRISDTRVAELLRICYKSGGLFKPLHESVAINLVLRRILVASKHTEIYHGQLHSVFTNRGAAIINTALRRAVDLKLLEKDQRKGLYAITALGKTVCEQWFDFDDPE
jgi:hypothetical protein